MKRAFCFLVALIAMMASAILFADGIPIANGHFTGGKVSVLTLTKSQVTELASGYTLHLTKDQKHMLQKEAGVYSSKLVIYDTRKGETDCTDGLHNIGLRFSETQIEVPHIYLVSDKRAAEIEKEWNEK